MTSHSLGHIVAMGGGGFSMEQGHPPLDDFVLSLSRRHPARVCFIPTASADSPRYIVKFYRRALAEAVSSRPDAGAYRIARVDGRAVETRLPVRYLGDHP